MKTKRTPLTYRLTLVLQWLRIQRFLAWFVIPPVKAFIVADMAGRASAALDKEHASDLTAFDLIEFADGYRPPKVLKIEREPLNPSRKRGA